MSPARARTRTAQSKVERNNHEATTPPTSTDYIPSQSKLNLEKMEKLNKKLDQMSKHCVIVRFPLFKPDEVLLSLTSEYKIISNKSNLHTI